MLKHDSSEETKTYSADSYERKICRTRKEQRIKKDIIDIQEKAIYESHENKLVYTYVLKDIQKNIYKIGKTADPHARFKSLCVRAKYFNSLSKDVEDILHAKYADNRIVNEDYKLNGATEWFRPGGKFDEFIASVDKGVFLPYVTLHSLVQDLLENKTLDLTTPPQNGSYHRTSLGTIL
jgi:hypothetical protein